MTSRQMLERITPKQPPPEQGVRPAWQQSAADHVIKLLAPPANEGVRFKRSAAEPWILEQLANGSCPTCQEHLLHMVSPANPGVHHYTCEDSPIEHRWTMEED